MRNFTKAENDRVDFLIEEIKYFNTTVVTCGPLLTEYLNELVVYVILNHPKANDFYYYGVKISSTFC